MPERMQATVPVFLFLIDPQDRLYLQQRANTGYLDGSWEPMAGKTDVGEFPVDAACREASEEAGVQVRLEDAELFHAYMNLTDGKPWLGLMFRTRTWEGAPSIQEPEKCSGAGFFSLDMLPQLTPQVQDAIQHVLAGPAIQMANYRDITHEYKAFPATQGSSEAEASA